LHDAFKPNVLDARDVNRRLSWTAFAIATVTFGRRRRGRLAGALMQICGTRMRNVVDPA